MPELPEVETVARELRLRIIGKEINAIEALWSRSFQNMTDSELSGQHILEVGRRGKYLILKMTKTWLVAHLRMTGQLLYFEQTDDCDFDDYIRVVITFSDQSCLLFKDVRKFGRIYHVENPDDQIAHVGTDALEVDIEYFSKCLKACKMNIKAFLLSQKYISGVGNIYADEALFLSGLHPSVISNKIKEKKARFLFENIQYVLKNSIVNMGSTISDYRDPAGEKGKNQFYFKVYGRTGLPCTVCGTPIEKIRFAGRGTHFCPECQKNK